MRKTEKRQKVNTNVYCKTEEIPMENVNTKKGMVLPFTPLALSFDDVKYFVDMPVVIF